MQINIENEIEYKFDFDYKKLIEKVVNGAIDYIKCPYECVVEVLLVDDKTIRDINKDQRGIDKSTDVLSFPVVEYVCAGRFEDLEEDFYNDCFEPDTGELLLGDIVISVDTVVRQAKEYGHSIRRELGFLVAHSMFHLFGFDHMEDDERIEMERMQKDLLISLGVTRDDFENEIKSAKDENIILLDKAKEAMENAYAPYSGFKVGAALLCENGDIFCGCNVENGSFGATVCAERVAVFNAISAGNKEFVKLAIVSKNIPTFPCGMCRQVLMEFTNGKELVIVLEDKEDKYKEYMLNDLLPNSFIL